MKFTNVFLSVVLALHLFSGVSARADLVVHLGLDEGVGTTINNAGATGDLNDGTLGANNAFVAGKIGSGLSFDGSGASDVAAGVTPLIGGAERTVSVWFKSTGGAGIDSLLTFGPNLTGTKFDFDIDNANGGHLELGVGDGRTNFTGLPSLTDDTWRLATVIVPDTADATLQDVAFYVDGQFVTDGTAQDNTREVVTGAGGGLFLGRGANGGGFQPLLGSLDDVAIWDEALTPDEITSLFDVADIGLSALDFDILKELHDSGSGTAIADNAQWQFAAGLSGAAGLNGNDLTLNDASNTGVSLTGVTFSPADANLDGVITGADLQLIANNFNQSAATARNDGDLNGDGFVDHVDLRIFETNPTVISMGILQGVPEPAAVVLLAPLALGLLRSRRVAAFACLLLVASLGATADAQLLVHLPFDETSGTTVANNGSTGAANDGTLGAANTFIPGAIGGAIGFDATAGSVIETGSTPLTGTGPRTFSAWVNTSGASGQRTIASFGVNGNGLKFDLDYDNGTNSLEVGVGGGRTSNTGTAANNGQWRLTTVILPDTPGATLADLVFYVDGVLSHNGNGTRAINTSGGGQMRVGAFANVTAGAFWDGGIDDVALWDVAFTADEMLSLFEVGDQLSLDAGAFNQLKGAHDFGPGGVAIVDGIRWDFVSGLAGPAGVSGSNVVFNASAGTGVFNTGVSIPVGDVDLNGTIDIADVTVIAQNFRTDQGVITGGDLSGDGFVDFADFRIWKNAAPASLVAGLDFDALLTVPEPTAAGLLLLGCLGAIATRSRRVRRGLGSALALAALVGYTSPANAQFELIFEPAGGVGDWSDGSSWNDGFAPVASFDETALINDNNIANVTNGGNSAGDLAIGRGAGQFGTLNITSGGVLSVVEGTDVTTTGTINAGQNGGRGAITIDGGSLTTESLNVTGAAINNPLFPTPASSLTLSGSASVTVNENTVPEPQRGNMFVSGVLTITGPDASVSVANNFTLGGVGTYLADITSTTAHSVISAGGAVTLNGDVEVSLPVGAAVGDSWDLFDAGSIANNATFIEAGVNTPGRVLSLNTAAGGTNGVVASVEVDRVMVLEVDRDTGSTVISNPFGPATDFDGYSVLSPSGALDTNGWNSLDEQGVPSWLEANGVSTALNEFKTSGQQNLSSASTLNLGAVYKPAAPAAFGDEVTDDLSFVYTDQTGDEFTGQVVYSGGKVNTLLLTVDPVTGAARLTNDSTFDIDFDAYAIASDQGLLDSAAWLSLDAQSGGDIEAWTAGAGSNLQLAEVLDGAQSLGAGQSVELGVITQSPGSLDVEQLSLSFALDGEIAQREGSVVIEEFSTVLPGDFNGDGLVGTADFTVWRDNLNGSEAALGGAGDGSGTVDIDDYLLWKANFGAEVLSGTGSGSVAAAPEPASAVVLLMGAVVAGRRRLK